MDDLLGEFLTETAEALAELDVELVRLEQNPNDPKLIGSIFRIVHTIKGTCGFLDLPRLEALGHAAENVLGRFRDRELEVTPASVTLILRTLDQIKAILATLERTEKEPAGDDSGLIAQLNAVAEGHAGEEPAVAEPDRAELDRPAFDRPEFDRAEPDGTEAAAPDVPAITAPVEPRTEPAGDESRPAAAADSEEASGRELSAAGQSIRVSVTVLENLMTTVSELVLVRNQLLQMVRNQEDSGFSAPLQQLNHITSELQEGVMKTRMQPIGNAWSKLPRIVRDIAHGLGKKVDLEMVGADTELDRQVLELIKDPLTHMIRNAVDHGLERPADRAAAGKPETGRIRLHAYHEGGHIIVAISDDGRGLSIAKIREKIVRNGLASAVEVEAMSDLAAQQYIFKAGFSTAEQVTNVSGRGVGMDVVRSNIEKIGGSIEMQSEAGRGTTFLIKIPLTLAIVSALIVECRDQRFAIPQIGVRELVRASRLSEHRIESIAQTPVLRLRERLLPLVSLRELLGLGEMEDGTEEVFVVVSQVGTYTFGIMVDKVFDAEEIVVKPVAPVLRDNPVYSGNTILGDGSIVMILDPNGIAAARAGTAEAGRTEEETTAVAANDDRVPLLLFRAGTATPRAIPLALVARLEEIDVTLIEQAEGRPVVQYRGSLMPLVSLDPAQACAASGRQQVIVFAERDRSMGLMVDEIIDIVEDRLDFKLSGEHGRGIMGTAVICGKATEIVDTGYFLTRACEDWFSSRSAGSGNAAAAKKVLFVDDSAFFRNLLAPLLATAGYAVTTAEGPEKALALREAGHVFDVIISDIDMPDMDGLRFAETVKREGAWRDVPMIALSARAEPADVSKGRVAGFAGYVPKLDRVSLLETLSQTLSGAAA